MLWLVGQGLDLPVARHTASGREIAWKRPGYSTVLNILRDPIYAGAYRYGKSAVRSVIREGRLRKLVVQNCAPTCPAHLRCSPPMKIVIEKKSLSSKPTITSEHFGAWRF